MSLDSKHWWVEGSSCGVIVEVFQGVGCNRIQEPTAGHNCGFSGQTYGANGIMYLRILHMDKLSMVI